MNSWICQRRRYSSAVQLWSRCSIAFFEMPTSKRSSWLNWGIIHPDLNWMLTIFGDCCFRGCSNRLARLRRGVSNQTCNAKCLTCSRGPNPSGSIKRIQRLVYRPNQFNSNSLCCCLDARHAVKYCYISRWIKIGIHFLLNLWIPIWCELGVAMSKTVLRLERVFFTVISMLLW